MALIDRERLVCIGRVVDAHGLAGELKVAAITADPGYYEDLEALYLDGPRGLRLAQVQQLKTRGRGWVLGVTGVADRTSAEALRGAEVLIDRELLKPLAAGEFFTQDLIGCDVVTVTGQELGRVQEVIETGANAVLRVDGAQGEVLIPMIDSIVKEVDIEQRRLSVDPPAGMVPGAEPGAQAAPEGPKRIDVLTLFPELFTPFQKEGLIGRAIASGLLALNVVNFRQHGLGRHRQVDDVPYGGGAGMVLRPEPVFAAVRERRALHGEAGRGTWVVLLTPQGRPFRQRDAQALAVRKEVLVFVCGRYEGFDERIRTLADEELSLGDFVSLGGEAPAMTMIEAVARWVPGVLGNPESTAEESFAQDRLEYPQYTRPPEFEGMRVPEILLSGHHGGIARWREAQARERTARRRPDLLERSLLERRHAAMDAAAATETEDPAAARKRRGHRRDRSDRP